MPIHFKKYFPKIQSSYSKSLKTAYLRQAKPIALCFYSDVHNILGNAVNLVDDLKRQIHNLKCQLIWEKARSVTKPSLKFITGGGVEKVSPLKESIESLEWLESRQLIDELRPENLVQVVELYNECKPIYDAVQAEKAALNRENITDVIRNKVLSKTAEPSTINELFPNPIQQLKEYQKADSMLLSELIKKYCDDLNDRKKWRVKTYKAKLKSFELLFEFLGDIPIATITRDNMREYRSALLKLPANRKKKKKYKYKSIRITARLALPEEDLVSTTTVNGHLIKASSIFKWASIEGYIDKNIATNLTIDQDTKDSDFMFPFTDEDLDKIFSLDFFTKRFRKHNFHYWLPVLGIFTGCRLNELAQLYKEDVYKKSEGWVLNINEKQEDKRLKNKYSARIIPVHDELIRIGFLDFVKSTVKNERLFKEIKYREDDGYSAQPSKWFTEVKKKLDIENRDKKTFHSFRKSFTNTIKQSAKISEGVVDQLTGHMKEGISYNRYAQPYNIKLLLKAMQYMNYKLPPTFRPYS